MTIMSQIQQSIQEDVEILLNRALLAIELATFGEDGLGQHGRSDRPMFFSVLEVTAEIQIDSDDAVTGTAFIVLENYDAAQFGHICTDKNFEISVRKRLAMEEIEPSCLTYAPIEEQGEDYVAMRIDVQRLLDWP